MTLRLHYCLFDYVQRFAKGTPLPIGKIAKKEVLQSHSRTSLTSCGMKTFYCDRQLSVGSMQAWNREKKEKQGREMTCLSPQILPVPLDLRTKIYSCKARARLGLVLFTNHLSISISISVSSGTPELCIDWLKSKNFSSESSLLSY